MQCIIWNLTCDRKHLAAFKVRLFYKLLGFSEEDRIPTDTPTELGTQLLTYRGASWTTERGERGDAQKQKEEREKEEARMEEPAHSAKERVSEKHAKNTKMDTEGRGQAGTSQSHSSLKK